MTTTLALGGLAPAATPWPRRWALLAALAAVPLVLFGGSVTTLGAGMAVDGWWIAEGHFLLFFPVEKWFRDTGTFVEHTHRLFGMLVGLFAVACVLATWLRAERAGARWSAALVLSAVVLQGTLGGLRVLGDDSELAFLHGALAQLVFAGLCANVACLAPDDPRSPAAAGARAELRGLVRAAGLALAATSLQAVLGAWYRHGLRPAPVETSGLRLLLHGLGAVLVLATVAAVVRAAAALRARAGELPARLGRAVRILPALLLAQLCLGGLAWAGFRPGRIGPAEWALSIAHVLGGALTLGALAVVVVHARRLASEPAEARA